MKHEYNYSHRIDTTCTIKVQRKCTITKRVVKTSTAIPCVAHRLHKNSRVVTKLPGITMTSGTAIGRRLTRSSKGVMRDYAGFSMGVSYLIDLLGFLNGVSHMTRCPYKKKQWFMIHPAYNSNINVRLMFDKCCSYFSGKALVSRDLPYFSPPTV